MPPPSPRILVIKRRYLGDIVLLGRFFRSLRQRWPEAELHALVEDSYAGVLALNPDVKAAVPMPRKLGPLAWLNLIRTLRANRYTHVLNLDNTEKTAVLTRLSGARHRAGLYLQDQKLRLRFAYTMSEAVEPEFRRNRHITDYYNRLLHPLGIEPCSDTRFLKPSATDKAWAESLLSPSAFPAPGPRLLLHPGSRSAFRIWPASCFAQICDTLQNQGNARVTLIAGPAEQAVVDNIRSEMRTQPLVVSGPVSIGRMAALMQAHQLFLCHDSGPMHLAAALDVPVVALFSSQNINEWRPLGDKCITLQPPLPCTTCVAPDVCVPSDSYRNFCVRNITPERVLDAVLKHLASSP